MDTAPPKTTACRWRVVALSIVAAVALYAVVAGLLVPHFARSLIAEKIGERLGRTVAIDDLSFNPFTLDATVTGVRVMEPDNRAAFASFDRLDVDGSFTSIYRLAPVANAVTLDGLKVNLVRDGESHYNVTDIIGRLAAAPAAGKPSQTNFSVSNIRITNGRVDFDDRPKGTKHQVTEINVAIPFISNLPTHLKEFVQPSFSAKVNDTPVSFTGETLPFEQSLRTQVAIQFESLDIPRYAGYSPAALPVKVDAGKLDTRLLVRFTHAAGKDPSIDIAGTVALRDARLSNADGSALAEFGRIDLDLASLDPLAKLVQVSSLRVAQASVDHGKWNVPATEAKSIRIDAGKRVVRVESISTRDGVFALTRNRDGAIEMPPFPRDSGAATTDSAPWQVSVGKASIDSYNVALADESVKPAVTHRVAIAHLEAADLTTEKNAKGTMNASLRIGKSGTVGLESSFGLDPLSLQAHIDARHLDLVAVRPYAEHFATVSLKSGDASAQGVLTVTGEGDAMRIAYTGTAGIANVATLDKVGGEDLVNWDAVSLTGMDLRWTRNDPLRLTVADVAVKKAYARVVVTPEGKINLQQLKFATADHPDAAVAPAPAKPRDVRIDRITFVDSRLDFADHFIKPNYAADVGDLHGSVSNLSSDEASRGVVDLEGRYDKTSPVTITGTINPLSGNLFLDIAAKGQEIELPKLTAYSERYAGYGITQGKLTLDVKYHVEDGKLEGRNKILIDQLVFGNKVESPEATKLPVLFAVNLLKDSKGAINLELPISGSLDDPQFKIGDLIMQVMGSLLKKALTSPFSLLTGGSGSGGGAGSGAGSPTEDLNFVDFKAGSDDIGPETGKKLDAVAKALLDRPAIKIELASRADPENDLPALRQAALARELKEAKGSALAAKGQAVPAGHEITLEGDEYPRYLKLVFEREKKAQKETAPKDVSVAQMEAYLLERIAITAEDLTALATRRSEGVKSYLVEKGHLPPERVLVASSGESVPQQDNHESRVELTLK